MFDLKRPCRDCPVRADVPQYVTAARLAEFVQAVSFQCHKTGERSASTAEPQQCAGLMILLKKSGLSNAMMQIGERLGHFDPTELDDNAPVYSDLWAAIAAHGGNPDKLLPSWMRRSVEAAAPTTAACEQPDLEPIQAQTA